MTQNNTIKSLLLARKIIDKKSLEELEKGAKEKGISLEDHLFEKRIISEELLYRTLANEHKLPFVDPRTNPIPKEILLLIPESIARAHQIVAFEKTPNTIKLAAFDPLDLQMFEFIGRTTGLEPKINLSTPTMIREVLNQYHLGLKAEFKEFESKEIPTGPDQLKKMAEDLPVIKMVDTLLEYAILERASDIHIEPMENDVNIRYRIDGILRNVMILPKQAHAGVISRIKILSNLKLDEHRLPQDGRFKISTPQYDIAFRVSIIPTFDGEKIVLRLLDEKNQIFSLEQLGFEPRSLEIIKRNITRPHGMILATGPTGSGKTTTLYTILNLLNSPSVNISTIEDPIEYRIQSINQSQVNPKIGFTFAVGLRAFLRQDPNIIMVGEIRDIETAEISIHAALTGHLVLSTLHTNDAPSGFLRLLDMGAPAFLLSSTINLVIAQRLARKICSDCIESYNLSDEKIKELEKEFDIKSILKTLEREQITQPGATLKSILFYQGKGCKRCNNEGYKGRIGLYEVLEATKEMRELVLKRPSVEEIRSLAQKQSMVTIAEDGFIKAIKGITTIEEVIRVTQE
jgi:type IV pilus assembly protein PilB